MHSSCNCILSVFHFRSRIFHLVWPQLLPQARMFMGNIKGLLCSGSKKKVLEP